MQGVIKRVQNGNVHLNSIKDKD